MEHFYVGSGQDVAMPAIVPDVRKEGVVFVLDQSWGLVVGHCSYKLGDPSGEGGSPCDAVKGLVVNRDFDAHGLVGLIKVAEVMELCSKSLT
jgi:hypothetical protein